MTGPLAGLRVIEMAGMGPAPFAAMMLSDMGADVVRIDRPSGRGAISYPTLMDRGRRSVAIDLKHPDGPGIAGGLIAGADVLIEGYRPGVMERLGLGPQACLERNPALVYGRMTGYGQTGPLAHAAGHDIDYIAIGGALGLIGRAGQPPTPPLNLVGDLGGGAMFLCFGLVCGVLSARASGLGQVVDAAMIDGVALQLTPFFPGQDQSGQDQSGWGPRGTNLLDSGAPFYDVYETADGQWVAVGAIEPHCYAELLRRLGLDDEDLPSQLDQSRWPELRERIAAVFRAGTRAQWSRLLEGTDACAAPVLSLDEIGSHPHNASREMLVECFGVAQPAPAPRFGRTPGAIAGPPPRPGEHSAEVLRERGFGSGQVEALLAAGVVSQS